MLTPSFMPKFQSVTIIIVNYNTAKYITDCIDSLFKQRGVELQVIVVDNASHDNSVVLLQQRYAERIHLIQSSENLGFGRANNLAATHATGDFLLLLNPDALLTDSEAIIELIAFMTQSQGYGMVGPAIYEPRKHKVVKPRMSYPLQKKLKCTHKLNGLPGSIAWLLGACLLTKTSIYRQIDGFDPDFFLYGEDVDICLRIRLAGYALGYADDVRIEHVAGASEVGAVSYEKWLRKKRGYYLFCQKHYAREDILRIVKTVVRGIKTNLFFLALAGRLKLKKESVIKERTDRLMATLTAANELIE